ncbi:MAG: hypothetical protein GW893_23490, partial [Armatimonadetes bacterium]|nr:hypothetical protein [Armatimonadota bacterium]
MSEEEYHKSAVIGDHCGIVQWPGEYGLSNLRGTTIRLRFHLTHARLFTFEAR